MGKVEQRVLVAFKKEKRKLEEEVESLRKRLQKRATEVASRFGLTLTDLNLDWMNVAKRKSRRRRRKFSRPKVKKSSKSVPQALKDLMSKDEIISTQKMKERLTKEGIPREKIIGIHTSISKLVKDGKLKRLSKGSYRVLK